MFVILASKMSVSENCLQKFQDFMLTFNKTYENQEEQILRQKIFCDRYKLYLKYKTENSKINAIFDRKYEELVSNPHSGVKQKKLKNQGGFKINKGDSDIKNLGVYPSYCESYYCYVQSQLETLEQIYDQIDFRKEGLTTGIRDQGSYGSCYAFSAATILENALLLERNNYNNASNSTLEYWYVNASNGTLSPQYIMTNTFPSSYSQGGDATLSINYVGYYLQTFEYEALMPYNPSLYMQYYLNRTFVISNQTNQNKLLPYNQFYVRSLDFSLPINGIYLNYDNQFDANAIQAVMSVLSRGIAVLASMNTQVSERAEIELSMYGGNEILDAPCDGKADEPDHAVTFIGYGNFKGTKVWIIKNSWGEYGDQGSFYVPIGKDSYCIEHYAFYIVPLFYNMSTTELYNKSQFQSAYSTQSNLDEDDGQLIQNNLQPIDRKNTLDTMSIILIVIACLVILATIIWVIVCCINKHKHEKARVNQLEQGYYQYFNDQPHQL